MSRLPRYTALRSSGGPKRKTRVKAVNAKRKAKNWERAYGSPERVEWVSLHGCLVCASRPSENAHTETGGMGRKADAETIVPLCTAHHRELHDHGAATFATQHAKALGNRPLAWWAALVEGAWQSHEILRTSAPKSLAAIIPVVVADVLDERNAK